MAWHGSLESSPRRDVQYWRTSSGEVYGFVLDGKMYIDPQLINPETPIHEYSHLWDRALQRVNPELWARGKELMKELSLWDEVKNDPAYKDIADDEDLLASEVHSRLSGKKGAKHLDDMVEEAKRNGDYVDMAKAASLKEHIKTWLRDVLAWVRDAFSAKWGKKELSSLTVEEFAAMPIKDLIKGVNPKEELAKATRRINSERELVAVHNLTEKNLEQALELGGFPLPSIAITKGSIGHTNFGEISLVFDKDTIDPKNRKNKVYSHDAWTPTFPEIGFKINPKAANNVRAKIHDMLGPELANALNVDSDFSVYQIDDAINRSGGDLRRFIYNDAMRVAYLKAQGLDFEVPIKESGYGKVSREIIELAERKGVDLVEAMNGSYEYYQSHPDFVEDVRQLIINDILKDYDSTSDHSDAFYKLRDYIIESHKELPFNEFNSEIYYAHRLAYDLAHGGVKRVVDSVALTEKLKEMAPIDAEYKQWVTDLFDGVVERRGIRNERNPFTPAANRRKWESLYDDVTLDNVVKAMLRQASRGGKGIFGSNPIGASAREYSSISEIRTNAKERMQVIDQDEFVAQADGFKKHFMDVISNVLERDGNSDFGRAIDAAVDFTGVIGKTHTADGLYRQLHGLYPKLTMDDAKALETVIKDVQKAATRLFEAKPQRAVGFEEVRLAVVPEDMDSRLVEALKGHGIEVRTYERGNDEERIKMVDDTTREMDIQFQILGEQGATNLDVSQEATTRMDNLRVARVMEARLKEIEGSEEHQRMVETAEKVRGLKAVVVEPHSMSREEQKAMYQGFKRATNKGTGVTVEFFGSAFEKNHRDGGLFEKAIPGLKAAFEDAVLISSEADHRAGEKRPDGSLHKEHRSVQSFDDYIGKVKIDGKEYYVRYTVQIQKGQNGIHSQFVSNINLYDTTNPTEVASYRDSSLAARLDFDGIVDVKLQNFFILASGDGKSFAQRLKFATGWERGGDGKWRYEVPDGNLAEGVAEDFDEGRTDWTLGEFWNDDALFEAYPELRDYQVTIDPDGTHEADADAVFDSESKTLTLSDGVLIYGDTSVIAHEIQHAIQEIEGFAKGTTPQQAGSEDAYTRTMGEVEARNVQTRMGMSEEERRNTLLESTEDVSRGDQIFLENNLGTSASISDDTRFRERESLSEEERGIVEKAKGDGTYMKAPNGKPTKLTEKQWAQVRTKAFKAWFGDWENDPANSSKAVDENGEPMVVYHQTNSKQYVNRETGQNWDDLDWRERDEWENRDDWDEYWEEQDFYTFDNKNHGRRSVEMPAYFFSPVEDPNHEYGERTIAAFLNVRNPAINPTIENAGVTNTAGEDAMNRLIEAGHDGFFRIYEDEGKETWEYNAFKPNQIKSATENNGNFSTEDDDIRFRDGKSNIKSGVNALHRLANGEEIVEDAMERDDLAEYGGTPSIAFEWGKSGNAEKGYNGGYGISHILSKHGIDTMVHEIDVIANGEISRYVEGNKTVVISKDGYEAVLALTKNGNQESWLLTGWNTDVEKEKADVQGEVRTQSETTQTNPTFSREDLGAALSDAKLQNIFESFIDKTDENKKDSDIKMRVTMRGRENERTFDAQGARDEKSKVEAAQALTSQLNSPAHIITNIDDIKQLESYKNASDDERQRMLHAKGWFDHSSGQIVKS